ncbi:hypothetical protein AYO44_00080 [Planctomycetaceae bacterium SCGC AG-212-F19]|nr:hypothetical protein AYO44_00080 [Planctomycetaceae bacterium SCGC AG-212-F19]
MKAGLSLLLMLLTATGPWLCCCTAGQATAATPAPDSAPKPSCCHAVKVSPGSSDTTPLAPNRPCSCQHERLPATLAMPDTSAPELGSFAVPMIAWAGIPVELLTELTPAPVASLSATVHSQDILRLCHMLRC